jgi:hypothetical protein
MSPLDGMLALPSDHDAAQAPDCSVVPNLATGAARALRSDVACGIRRMIVRSRSALINMRLDEETITIFEARRPILSFPAGKATNNTKSRLPLRATDGLEAHRKH